MIKFHLTNLASAFARDRSGAAAVEYAVLAAVIGTGLITASNALVTGIQGAFDSIVTALAGV